MPVVAAVRLKYVPKNYWFDPAGNEVHAGDHVLVETERGQELGLCVEADLDVPYEKLRSPLKNILRVATEEDFARIDELQEENRKAYSCFRRVVDESGLDMKPVSVEYSFDGSRAVFYFTSEDRIDFRSMVRTLASELHTRVDMRQIGVRDEARALGGLSHCGQELCCARMGGDFMPVSIRMAKEQDLPLNPAKISGLCGRLMCCLRYEFDAYKDFKSRSPKKNALIDTPLGLAKVVEFDTPRELVRVRFEDGKSMEIPVGSMDTGDKEPREGENLRPCHVSQEAFDKILEDLKEDTNLAMMGEKLFSQDPDLADREAKAGVVERGGRRRRKHAADSGAASFGRERKTSSRRRHSRAGDETEPKMPARTSRRRRRSVSVADGEVSRSERNAKAQGPERRSRGAENSERPSGARRRRRAAGASGQESGNVRGPARSASVSAAHSQGKPAKPRPGQHSSTVSGDAMRSRAGHAGQAASGASAGGAGTGRAGAGEKAPGEKGADASRKRRRRGRRGGKRSSGAAKGGGREASSGGKQHGNAGGGANGANRPGNGSGSGQGADA